MKEKRGLSGIYFRHQEEDNGSWDNRCFEDLSEERQREILEKQSVEWLHSMILKLSSTINDIGDQLNLYG